MNFFRNKKTERQRQHGFTIVEIAVSTTLFAIVASASAGLFVYALKINRKSEALRQATQAMRDFVEFVVKEVRNGQIDYGFVDPDGHAASGNYPLGPCTAPAVGSATYSSSGADNKLGIITSNGDEECVYLAYGPGAGSGNTLGTYVGSGVYTSNTNSQSSGYNPNPILAVIKSGVASYQSLNPPNSRVDSVSFFVRPAKDPYYTGGGPGTIAGVQPFVTMAIKFVIQLPTGELVPMYYQTSVSTNKYDVPHS